MVSRAGGSGTLSCTPWKLTLHMSTRIGSTRVSSESSRSKGRVPAPRNDSRTSSRFRRGDQCAGAHRPTTSWWISGAVLGMSPRSTDGAPMNELPTSATCLPECSAGSAVRVTCAAASPARSPSDINSWCTGKTGEPSTVWYRLSESRRCTDSQPSAAASRKARSVQAP